MATTHMKEGQPHMGHPHDFNRMFSRMAPGQKKEAPPERNYDREASPVGPPPVPVTESSSPVTLNNMISEFRSNEGYARPNHYEVQIYKPTVLSGSAQSENTNSKDIDRVTGMDKISMRCESITLPGRTLSTVDDTNMHGPVRQVVDKVMYSDAVEMTFQSSADGAERVAFEKWQYRAFNPKTWQVGYYNDYVSTVVIFLLDHQMNRRYGIQLMEAFPKILGDVSLSAPASAEIIKWTVTMNFRYWQNINDQKVTQTDIPIKTSINVAEKNLAHNKPAVLAALLSPNGSKIGGGV